MPLLLCWVLTVCPQATNRVCSMTRWKPCALSLCCRLLSVCKPRSGPGTHHSSFFPFPIKMSVSLGNIIHKYHWNAQKQLAFLQGRGKADSNPVSNDMIKVDLDFTLCFPGGSEVKNLPAMHETWVRSLGQESPLEKEMAIHSSILAWRIPWTEEPGGLQSTGLQSRTQQLTLSLSFKDRLGLKAVLDSWGPRSEIFTPWSWVSPWILLHPTMLLARSRCVSPHLDTLQGEQW